jgi:endonuclease-3
MNVLSKEEIIKVYNILDEMYPEAFCGLVHNNNFELLIATILSAQCTDKRVNIITKELFKLYKTPEEIVKLGSKELKKIIKSCGLAENKSKNIVKSCKIIIEEFHSEVPNEINDLLKLSGVGIKTANVVLSVGFGVPRMPVDTHVFRVSNRIGIVSAKNVNITEKMLMERYDKSKWIRLHHLFIFHGRALCKARNPKCELCGLKNICLEYSKGDKNE